MRNNIVVNGKMCYLGVGKVFQKKTGRQIALKISELIAKTFCK
jgi:hypothetical protein